MEDNVIIDHFTDVDGKLVISPDDTLHKKYEIGNVENKTFENCKTVCVENKECIFIQYQKSKKDCRYYRLLPSSNLFQWQKGETIVYSYSLPFNSAGVNPIKSLSSPEECNYQCQIDENCLYNISTYDIEEDNNIEKKEVCHRYSGINNSDYIFSYYNKVSEKLNIPLYSQLNNTSSNNQESIQYEPGMSDFYYRDENAKYSSSLLYGLTIIILVLVAIILFICKRRSDNEKELLYALSNMNGNSQSRSRSRSRSKSVHSENLSYINNTRLSASLFPNNYNLSSITIAQDNLDNSKYMKNSSSLNTSNIRKSYRKSISSKAPSVHSISTLCTSTSVNNNANTHTHNNNNNTNTNTNNTTTTTNNNTTTNTSINNGQGDSTLNEKSNHLLSLTTKKNSTYNYSIKTLSTKDPSLTGLSQNIKTLFANSYSSDTSSILLNNNDNGNGNGGNTRASISGNIISKDYNFDKSFNTKENNNNNNGNGISSSNNNNSSNTNVKNLLNHHKKQSSSVSIINIPKVASSSSINKNSQPKMIKLKKPVHTKQISISRSVYSESELSLRDELDKNNFYLDAQEALSLNTISNNNATLFKYK